MVSFFKIFLTISVIYHENSEKLTVMWLKIAIFYDVFECFHIFIVIRYLKEKIKFIYESFCSFLTFSENKFYFNKDEIFALDIFIEANSKLKYSKILNLLNKMYFIFLIFFFNLYQSFYIAMFVWGNYILLKSPLNDKTSG